MSIIFRIVKTGVMIIFTVASVSAFFPSPALSQEYKKAPIVLSAADLLPRNLLQGPNYKVKDIVISDGLAAIYELETFYGPLKVESTSLLLKRINELIAIHKIEQLEGTDTYINAFKQAATAPIDTAVGLVTAPVETVTGVTTGIGQFFGNIERSVTGDDPHQPGAAKDLLGQSAYKRQFAYEFGVDPYSNYAPLQKVLDDLSWTAAAGGLTVKAAMMAVPGAAGAIVGVSGTATSMKALVSENPPGKLEEINRAKLLAMGVSPALTENFLRNASYNPQEKTLLVGALSAMPGITGLPIYIERANATNVEAVTLFMRVRAQLMELYSLKEKAVTDMIEADGSPLLMTKDKKVVGIFPLDYVAWTVSMDQRESRMSAVLKVLPGITGKELWITGKVDAEARKAFEKRGWKVQDDIVAKFFNKLNY